MGIEIVRKFYQVYYDLAAETVSWESFRAEVLKQIYEYLKKKKIELESIQTPDLKQIKIYFGLTGTIHRYRVEIKFGLYNRFIQISTTDEKLTHELAKIVDNILQQQWGAE